MLLLSEFPQISLRMTRWSPRSTTVRPFVHHFRGRYSIDSIPDLTIGGWSHTPNWWWPDDRAWIVVSELDAPSTYVGGSEALVQAILNEPQIEAVNSHPEDRFDWLGDRINDLDSP